MSAGTLNMTAEQGATFNVVLTWKDSNDNPIDLTGYTARMQIRDSYLSSSTTLFDMTTANGKITLGGAAGTIALLLTAAETAGVTIPDNPTNPQAMPTKQFVYDLELVNAGSVTRLVQGTWTIQGEVTR